MSGDVLLDTNIVIALFAKDAAVEAALRETARVFVPAIVLGELYYGANKSEHVAPNLSRIDDFSSSSSVLGVDSSTAQHYGRVKNLLRAMGRPIPENDLWIAALSMQHGLTLVSRDAHFGQIEGLTVVTW